jgi:hypothetical protein
VLAVGTAPAIGFWVYGHGWTALCIEITTLNLLMAAIAWWLPDDHVGAHGDDAAALAAAMPHPRWFVEWRVLALSGSLALVSFGYGGLTSFSALYADAFGVTPLGIFLAAMAVSILSGRLIFGRSLDRIGHQVVLQRCLLLPPIGLAILALATGRVSLVVAALVFGAGFGLMHPAFTAFVMARVPFARRGAAFGAMLAAFDTGIGTGSSAMGWIISRTGFRVAFGLAAALAARRCHFFADGLFSTDHPQKDRPASTADAGLSLFCANLWKTGPSLCLNSLPFRLSRWSRLARRSSVNPPRSLLGPAPAGRRTGASTRKRRKARRWRPATARSSPSAPTPRSQATSDRPRK